MNAPAKPSDLNSYSERSAGSNGCASTPFSSSALRTALPDSIEISRSALGPPISTATFPNSLTLLLPFRIHPHRNGRLLRPPAPAAPQHRVGLAPSAPPLFRTRSRCFFPFASTLIAMGGCFALPHRLLRSTASVSPHQHRHFSELAHAASSLSHPPSSQWAAASPSRTGCSAAPRRSRPISTATFPNSLTLLLPFRIHPHRNGRLLRPPAPAAPQHRVGLAPSAPPLFRTRSRCFFPFASTLIAMGGCFALPHRLLRSTASVSPHQHRHFSELA